MNGRVLRKSLSRLNQSSIKIETTFLSDGRKKGLWRLRYRNVKCLSEENVIQTFLNKMGQTDADSVAILTSSASDRVRSFAENLTAALAQNGVRAVFLVNPPIIRSRARRLSEETCRYSSRSRYRVIPGWMWMRSLALSMTMN